MVLLLLLSSRRKPINKFKRIESKVLHYIVYINHQYVWRLWNVISYGSYINYWNIYARDCIEILDSKLSAHYSWQNNCFVCLATRIILMLDVFYSYAGGAHVYGRGWEQGWMKVIVNQLTLMETTKNYLDPRRILQNQHIHLFHQLNRHVINYLARDTWSASNPNHL